MMILPFVSRRGDSRSASGNNRQSVAAENTGASSPRNKKDGRMTILLSRRGDSNTRPPRPERGALPTALLLGFRRKPRLFLRNFLARFTLFSQKRVQKYCFFLTYANNFALFFKKSLFCYYELLLLYPFICFLLRGYQFMNRFFAYRKHAY